LKRNLIYIFREKSNHLLSMNNTGILEPSQIQSGSGQQSDNDE
jgi:hypothetical protein